MALVALVLLSSATLRAANVNAFVYSVSGTVEAKAPGAGYVAVSKGDHLAIGTTVRTGDDGVAVIVPTGGAAIQVGNDSEVKFNEMAFAKSGSDVNERKAVLSLNKGVISALIDPSTPKVTDFKIQTPQGAAAARGTFYAVLVYNGKTYIGVKEGKVAATSK